MRMTSFAKTMALIAALGVSVPAAAQMTAADIDELQQRLEAQGLSWTAGETSMTRMSEEEFGDLLIPVDEYRAMVEEAREMRAARGPLLAPPLPAPEDPTFSWRDVDGEDWNSQVKNQANCGSCTIFAGVGAIEAAINIAGGDPDIDWDLSEQNLLSCTGVTCESGGMSPAAAFTWAVNRGVPDELCAPYKAVNGDCDEACEDIDDRSMLIADWDFVGNGAMGVPTVDQIKAALSDHGPVGTSMSVYADLQAYTGGVYEPSGDADELGGHSVVIVGWNDENNSWYVKNSWGAFWGDAGYFEIKRGTCGIGEATTSWVAVDPEIVPGSFTLDEDSMEASIQKEEPELVVSTVKIQRSAGEGDIPFKVSIPASASWLTVDPAEGTLGADDVELTFTFDIAGWSEGDEIDQEVVVEVLGAPGLARNIDVAFHVTNYYEPDPEEDAGTGATDDGGSGSGGCSVRTVEGASSPSLISILSSILI